MDEFQQLERLFNDHFGVYTTEDTHEPVFYATAVGLPTNWTDDEWDDNDDDDESNLQNVEDRISTYIDENEHEENSCGSGNDSIDEELAANIQCPCKSNCLEKFDKETVRNHIHSVREMEKNEKDMYIMGSLQKVENQETRSGKRKRVRYVFKFEGKTICRNVFCYMFDTGKKTLRGIQEHMNLNGATPRVHGNMGRKPHNALKYAEIKHSVDFIVAYADLHGLPMPAAPRGRDEDPPLYLPSSLTKKALHQIYVEACHDTGICILKLTSFKDVWKQCVPSIKISSPKEDVCVKCEVTRKRIADAVTEDDKLEAANLLRVHIEDAQRERQVYKDSVMRAAEEMTGYERPIGRITPLTSSFKSVHYTFDYSQMVTIPHHSRQMGPLYFVTGRKIQIFGIRVDGMSKQYNYLIDEDQTIGADGTGNHGPNAVISMLHHCLSMYGVGEKRCVLHADNCGGQNKNRFVLAYLCWRIHQNLHDDITLMMQIPGHTRCLIDSGFGHIKKLYRRGDCDSLQQLVDIVDKSAYSNIPVLYQNVDGNTNWTWYDWKSFLKRYFLPVKGIQKLHVFHVSNTHKESIKAREHSDAPERSIRIVKRNTDVPHSTMPAIIQPGGMSMERQQYLYKHVRQFVRPAFRDITCPGIVEE